MRTKDTILLEQAYEKIFENFYGSGIQDVQRLFMELMDVLEPILNEIKSKNLGSSREGDLFNRFFRILQEMANSGRFESFNNNNELKQTLINLMSMLQDVENIKDFDNTNIQKFINFIETNYRSFGL
jgi:hypothetical protein